MCSSKILVSPSPLLGGVRFSSFEGGEGGVGRDEKRTPLKTHALEATKISELKTGTPNENIVQKHLNTALLNVF